MAEQEIPEYIEKALTEKVHITIVCLGCDHWMFYQQYKIRDEKIGCIWPYLQGHLHKTTLFIFIWKKICSTNHYVNDEIRTGKWKQFIEDDNAAGGPTDPLMADAMFEAEDFVLSMKPQDMKNMQKKFKMSQVVRDENGESDFNKSLKFSWNPISHLSLKMQEDLMQYGYDSARKRRQERQDARFTAMQEKNQNISVFRGRPLPGL